MKCVLIAAAIAVLTLNAPGAEPRIIQPFETEGGATTPNHIDTLVRAKLKEKGIEPAPLCSDEVFLRRVYLDVIGTLPEPREVRAFLNDKRTDKRERLIDSLLNRNEFAEYGSLKWCDILRVKSEYPINLWPNAVQAYHRWVLDAIRQNRPYDQFAREMLTSSGSNFRVPQVNFYRAIQGREPSAIAHAVALTFMGTRLDKWPETQRKNLETFFSRVAYKKTDEWKEEIVYLDPAATETLNAVFPDGTSVRIPPDQDPREVFADWLIQPNNPWFARAEVNRVWYWLMGRGIIQEPDDIRPDNPPSNPELLAWLDKEFVDSHYNVRHLYRIILNSRTYQQSSIPRDSRPEAEALFAFYPVRRLDAEVLIDAFDWIGETGETYSSAIPEPFTFIPPSHRTIDLADGSITSSFLDAFGRPTRDTGLQSERNNKPTDQQRLYLINSTEIQRKVVGSPRLRALVRANARRPNDMIRALYVTLLSRYPTDDELATAKNYLRADRGHWGQGIQDLVWSLVNSKEFLYRH